jgi:hypothetical protein
LIKLRMGCLVLKQVDKKNRDTVPALQLRVEIDEVHEFGHSVFDVDV